MSVLTKRKIEFREDFAVAMIIGIVFLLVVVMVGVGAGLKVANSLDDSYFQTKGNRMVLSLNKEIASFDDSEYEPDITHIVYYYGGNKINNVKIFFAYETKGEARTAYKNISMEGKDWALKKKLQGRFVVFELGSDQYDQLTTEEVKESIISMKAAGGAIDMSEINQAE